MHDLPRRMLLATVRESRILLPVGDDLTFVARSSGDLSFRVNNETEATGAFTGDLRVTLERVHRPGFVDADGKTTISTRVGPTKYLLFSAEGLQWEYKSSMGMSDDLSDDRPTLINGIVWWLLPDKPNNEGWRVITLTNRTPLLRTRAFAWATDPRGPVPVVRESAATPSNGLVTVESPTSSQRRLKFSSGNGAAGVVSCILSRP